MKITKLFLLASIAVIAFASCQKSSQNLTNVIPSDAMYVAHIDVEQLVKKSNYDVFQNTTVARMVNLGKGMLGKEEAVDLLDAFTKDANSLGLNIKGDCFIYYDSVSIGIVMGVNNAEKVKNTFISFSVVEEGEVTFENGIYSFSESQVEVSWTKDKFLMLMPQINFYNYKNDDEVDWKALASKLLLQGEKESVNSNPAFAKFMADKKDISIFYTYSSKYFDFVLENISRMELPEETMAELKVWNGISGASYVSFEKGEIKAEQKVYYPNAESEKRIGEITTLLLGELKGEQLTFVPSTALFAFSANIKGEGVYGYLSQLGLASLIEENDREDIFKTVINEISGDVTFALNEIAKVKKTYAYGDRSVYEYDSTEPVFTVFVETKDGTKALNFVKNKFPNMQDDLTEIDAETFSMQISGIEQYFGVQGNTVFVTNSKSVFDNIISKSGNPTDLSKSVNGKVAVAGGDITSLKKIVLDEMGRNEKEVAIASDFIDLFGTYSYTIENNTNAPGEAKLEMRDKSKNSLAILCTFLDKTLTTLNDAIGF